MTHKLSFSNFYFASQGNNMVGIFQRIQRGAAALAVTGAMAAAPAQAGGITYLFNQVADQAKVTGFITTDGTLGDIGAANIVDWELRLDDGSSSDPLSSIGKFTLIPSGSQVAGFSAFTATPTALLFNFDGTGGALFQAPTIGANDNYLGFDSVVGGSGGTYSAIDWHVAGALIVIHYSGTTPVALSVPEPSSYAMLLGGLALLAWKRRKHC
jgi:hypothetical protein